MLGVASSATQIEGGELMHNWNDWYRRGRVTSGSNPARADDHYNRWREDADLMYAMGIRAYRFSIEWARLCPSEDSVDQSAVAHYREEIAYLKGKGFSLLLTIHHFTNPMWFEEKGGFAKPENMSYFIDFVELAVRSFGDCVSEYITINEPNIYAAASYYDGTWPPGDKSMLKMFRVMSVMSACHIKAYDAIHRLRSGMGYSDTKVSFANAVRIFEPANPKNVLHRINSALVDRIFQNAFTEASLFGIFRLPLRAPVRIKRGVYCDFIALNYYSRSTVSSFGIGVREACPKNDLGWEIYPEGIVRCAEKLLRLVSLPVYITENGTCDNEDSFRCRFIYDHLKELCESGLPVERYYHWCFCDNFEWLDGEGARFGLVHVDYESQRRSIKKSGCFYSEVLEAKGVTKEIFEKYVRDQQYHY
jgi:beta-glucosidase